MASENEFLLHAFLMGIFITFLYDILRIFRRVVPHRDFCVSLEDLCFWVYCGGEVFLLMYHESNGVLRWFAVFGAFAGMLLYRKLVSPWLVKYISLAAKKILDILLKILKFILKPGIFVLKRTKSGVDKGKNRVSRLFRHFMREVKFRLTNFLKILKINLKTK